MENGSEHLARQESGLSQIFILMVSTFEKILYNIYVAVRRQVKKENSSLPVAVRDLKTSVALTP